MKVGQKQKSVNTAFYVVKELLMTERTYKKDLEIINHWFRNAISHDNTVTGGLDELLFGLISPLYEFHCSFLKQIEQRLAFWESRSNTMPAADNRQISDVLFLMTTILPRYRNYLDHEEELLVAVDAECKENRIYDKLYREFEMQKVCYLPITSFLLKPPQRLLHYQLVLNKLLQLYSNSHPMDYADCQELLLRIGELTSSYQDRMRKTEMLQKLIELQQDLVGIEDILQPSRLFIREGCLQKLSSKGFQQRMFFLFSDMLVYASRMPTRSLQFKVHCCLSLSNMAIREGDQKAGTDNSFTIFAGNKVLVVAASSEIEKHKWLEDLEMALEHSASNGVETSDVLYPSLKSTSSSEAVDHHAEVPTDRQIQHRTNTLMHVCWHRNTSVSMNERSVAIRHLLSGYLLRKFKSGSGWQKLWVVFTNFCLFFYKSHQDDFPLASLPLLGYTVQLPSPADGIQKDFVFKLQFKNHIYLFRAESQYTFERWMEVIKLATSKSRHMRLFSRIESVNEYDGVN